MWYDPSGIPGGADAASTGNIGVQANAHLARATRTLNKVVQTANPGTGGMAA
jgi:hypothetical protein